jgi:multiple sugar transport system permease protein
MKSKKGILFILPGFCGVMIFYLIPFLDVAVRSFQKINGAFCGFDNYRQVIENKAFHLAVENTIHFVLACLPLLLTLSLLAAVILQRTGGLGKLCKSTYLIPLAVPAAGVVLLWKLIFDNHGMLNQLLLWLGQNTVDYMNTNASFYVLVFSYIWKNLGYTVVLWSAGLSVIPENIYEAAWVDGAGKLRTFLSITLPNLKQTAFTIVVISFLNSFKVFREAYLVAGNYPQESIYMLQHLFNNWFRELDMDKMAAAAVLLFLVILIFVYMLHRSWEEEY